MAQPAISSRPAPRASPFAFTLIELLAVVAVTGLLAVVAIPALNSLGASRSAAAESMTRNLSFARELATNTANTTWVLFDTGSNRYSILGEDTAAPGRSGALTITNPATQRPFVEQLGANDAVGVSIAAVDLEGLSEVGFDRLGRPTRTNGTLWTTTGVVTLNGSWSVRIAPRTGFVWAVNSGGAP